MELSAASAAVAKEVAMDTGGKTLLERVEPILSNLEKCFANNPNFETVYRGSDGKYHPGPAEIITKALAEELAPEKFRQDVKVKLKPKSRQHGSKSAGSSAKWECHRCGLRG